MAAIEAQGIRADLMMLTHLMQAYAVRRDVERAKVMVVLCGCRNNCTHLPPTTD